MPSSFCFADHSNCCGWSGFISDYVICRDNKLLSFLELLFQCLHCHSGLHSWCPGWCPPVLLHQQTPISADMLLLHYNCKPLLITCKSLFQESQYGAHNSCSFTFTFILTFISGLIFLFFFCLFFVVVVFLLFFIIFYYFFILFFFITSIIAPQVKRKWWLECRW